MPAGNVLVSVHDGNLVVRGDDLANGVRIARGTVAGQIIVTGEDAGGTPTTVNGQASVTVNGVRDDFRIRLRGGDDVLTLDAVFVPRELRVNTGTGNDRVFLTNTFVSDEVEIKTERGDDTVEISGGTFGDEVKLKLGRGNDTFAVQNARFEKDVEADGGSGFDRFLAQNANNVFGDDLDLDDFEASGPFVSIGGDDQLI